MVLTSLFSAKRLGSRGRGCLWIDKALRCTTAPSVELVDIGSVCKPRALLEELLRKEEGSPFTGCFAISGTDLVFLLSLMFIPLILDAMLVSPGTMCAKLGITGTIESSLPECLSWICGIAFSTSCFCSSQVGMLTVGVSLEENQARSKQSRLFSCLSDSCKSLIRRLGSCVALIRLSFL